MQSPKNTTIVFFAIFIVLILFLNCTQSAKDVAPVSPPIATAIPMTDSEFLNSSGSLAINSPDKFNWMIFARICKPAESQISVNGNLTTNNVVWESWPDDITTYPETVNPDSPPTWPVQGFAPTGKKLEKITQQVIRNKLLLKKGKVSLFTEPVGDGQEVRRNPASFNFIIKNSLWYIEGLQNAFKNGTSNGYHPVSFPVNAIEIKADWKRISKDSIPYYHWNYDASGNLYGLIALHIMTKALPNWTWATWEWVGNPARCDYLGCHDSFGVSPSDVTPNITNDKGYEPGQLTPELLQIFTEFGVRDEWKNYRLKGSQTDWIDATGRTTLLGNSILEDGFTSSSSCITCHANASFNLIGSTPASGGFTPEGNSQNGPVDPKIFWTNGKQPYGNPTFLQYDFVWALTKANKIKK